MTTSKLLLEAYPLHWPEGQPRKLPAQRRSGTFKVSLGIARDELLDELLNRAFSTFQQSR